jgi:D-galacturonate reductase
MRQYNPFYVKYSPDENGYFDGQKGYGYISLEKFIGASLTLNPAESTNADALRCC